MFVSSPFMGLVDLLRYFLVCFVAVSAGIGLIRLGRVPLGPRTRLLLSPVATHSLWAVLIGVGVAGGFPVRQIALPVWIATVPFALYGFKTMSASWHAAAERQALVVLAVCALLPLILLLPDSISGLSNYGGYSSDGWAYVAWGRYLWQFPNGTDGGLAPLYQWAAHLVGSRYVGGSELGVLSLVVRPGDTQAAAGLLIAVTFFSVGAALAAFAWTFDLSYRHVLLYTTVTVLSGWMLSVVQIDNYDCAYALAYFPALAALVRDATPLTRARWVFLGWLGAALFYTYPELSPVILGCIGLIVIERLWNTGGQGAGGVVVAIVVWIALTSPNLKHAVQLLQHQTAQSLISSYRPGEGMFPGLLNRQNQLSAFWALGGEFSAQSWPVVRLLVGIALSVLALAGLVRLAWLRAWSVPVLILGLCAGTAVFVLRYAYPYGAFKFILLDWWLLLFAVLLGATWPLRSARRTWLHLAWSGAALVVLLALPAAAAYRLVRSAPLLARVAVDQFRTIEQLPRITGGAPVGVVVHDLEASYWAVYFLRDTPLSLFERPGDLGMPHVQPFLARAPAIAPRSIRFLLTDAIDPGPLVEDEGWTLAWSVGPYALWDTQPRGWAIAHSATNVNGFETVNGAPFFWLGTKAASLEITGNRTGTARLAAQFVAGPHVQQGVSTLHLRVTSSTGLDRVQAITPGPSAICLPVVPGTTTWHLMPTDAMVMPAGGTPERFLLIGVSKPTLRWSTVSGDGC